MFAAARSLAIVASLAGLWPAAAAAQQPGTSSSFAQLEGPLGCLVQVGAAEPPAGCAPTRAVGGLSAMAMAPDGAQVAAVGPTTRGVTLFDRDAGTGALSFAACVTDNGGDGRPGSEGLCEDGDGLAGAGGVAFSPDGRFLYVTGETGDSVSWFSRAPGSGALTQRGCIKAFVLPGERCAQGRFLDGALGVAASPDGKQVYVAARNSSAITVFARDAQTGALDEQSCVSESGSNGGCARVPGLDGVGQLAMAPDGRNVYLAPAGEIGGVIWVNRNTETGNLSRGGCLLADAPSGGPCERNDLLWQAGSPEVSADGRDVFVAGVNADENNDLVDFARDESTGDLRQKQCLEGASIDGDFRGALSPGCDLVRALGDSGFAGSVASSADGRAVFAAADSVVALRRAPGSGTLTAYGCASQYDTTTCAKAPGASDERALIASRDGRNLYAASSEEDELVTTFAATVAVTRARAIAGGRVRVSLACPAVVARGCRGVVTASSRAASRRFALRRGHAVSVVLALSPRSRAQLRARGRARVRVRVRDAARRTAPVVRVVSVRHPNARRS